MSFTLILYYLMAYLFPAFKASEHAKASHYLVVGHPISHSLSPVMHQTALEFHQLKASYYAVDIRPDQVSGFAAWCNRDTFSGCNITLPYKKEFMSLVDHVDPVASKMGVINTIVKQEQKLVGYNTDAYGFLHPLQPYIDRIEGERALIFGTGGASKAVSFALSEAGIEEQIFVSRKPNEKNVTNTTPYSRVVDYQQWQEFAGEASIFVNTTPLGMYPDIEKTFLNENDSYLLQDKICYDLVYNPLQTKFLKQAEEAGAYCINGLNMLIHQGSKSFELWTGKKFPVEKVNLALQDFFNKTS